MSDEIKNKDMNEDEDYQFLKEIAEKVRKQRDEFKGVYVLNITNYNRFSQIYSYMSNFAKKHKGKIVYEMTDPDGRDAGLSIDVPCVDMYGDEITQFVKCIADTDTFGITPSASDSLIIDVTVNNVWGACEDRE